ncbi:MAG TPA: 50S ribosomal protein L33 [Candidatus Saccharimonadales bacterium]|nr:50S ribosomal protein L33 [Candidatus Saccharimonadales bacterium]
MAKKSTRERITLECSVCKERNYYSEKNKVKTPTRLELMKFCKRCQKATAHKESK